MSLGTNTFSQASVSPTCDYEHLNLDSTDDKVFDLSSRSNSTTTEYPLQYFASAWPVENCAPKEWTSSSTVTTSPDLADLEDDLSETYLAPSDMPSTREPSPEPAFWPMPDYFEQIRTATSGRHFLSPAPASASVRASSREPPVTQRGDMNPRTGQLSQVVLVPVMNQATNNMIPMQNCGVLALGSFPVQVTPAPLPADMPSSGLQTLGKEPSLQQPSPFGLHSRPSTPTPDEECVPAPKQKKQPATAHSMQSDDANSDKTTSRKDVKADGVFDNLSADQKEALCKYIYEFMVNKEFTKSEGYLVIDIFAEVWKGIGDPAEHSWRCAQKRFADLLRSAPQYFRLYSKGIQVITQYGWCSRSGKIRRRKGELMVRLVQEKKK
jgi:hypothetical protein